jgi:hypothetical protein
MKIRQTRMRKDVVNISETHERNSEHLGILNAILEALCEVETVSQKTLSLLQSQDTLVSDLMSMISTVLDELSTQQERVRIRATFRDFIAELRDRICEDMDSEIPEEVLSRLQWQVVTWNGVKNQISIEERLVKKNPGNASEVTSAFENVLLRRGLTRNDFNILMQFQKEAGFSFHKGDVTKSEARAQLEKSFPPDLEPFKPYLKKVLDALVEDSGVEES